MTDQTPTVVSEAILVRVCGLPVTAARDLRFPKSAALLDRILALEERLLAARNDASRLLRDLVPRISDRTARRAAIRLRRDLFNLRRPRFPEVDTVTRRLPPADRGLVESAARNAAAYEDSLTALRELVVVDRAASRQRLRRWLGQECFLRGLAVASPELCRQAQRLASAPACPETHKDRFTEAGLLRYLVRTATKTSPFSTFTPVAPARWCSSSRLVSHPRRARPFQTRSLVQGQAPWLHEICAALASPTRARYRLNEGRWHDGQRLWLLRRRRSERSLGVMQNSESIVSIAAHPFLLTFARELDGAAPLTIAELTAVLRRVARGRIADARLATLLTELIDAAMLCPDTPVPTDTADPWAFVLDRLHDGSFDQAAALRDIIIRMRDVARRFAPASSARRLAYQTEIDSLRMETVRLLDPTAGTTAANHRKLVVEDAGLMVDVKCGRQAWTAILADLRTTLVVYLILDPVLSNQYRLAAEYVAAYGPQHRFKSFFEFFQAFQFPRLRRIAAGLHPAESEAVAHSEPLTRLQELRTQLRAVLRAPESTDTTLRLPADTLRRWHQLYPYPHRVPISACFFLMLGTAENGDGPIAVVNLCGLGHGKHMSRFCRLMDAVGRERTHYDDFAARIRAHNRRDASDPVLADVGGYFGGFGVESRPPLTDYSIRYPGEALLRPEHEVISLADVEVGYNPTMGLLELWSTKHHMTVCPVHLGLLAPAHAPPLFRGLLEFSPPLSAGAPAPASWRPRKRSGIEYSYTPRVQVGRVVLSRAEWSVPTAHLPEATDPLAFWIALRRLARAIDLPREVFRRSDLFHSEMLNQSRHRAEKARNLPDPVSGSAPPSRPTTKRGAGPPTDPADPPAPRESGFVYRSDARKPMLLDMDSPPLVEAFAKSLPMMRDRVHFAEALPALGDSPITSNGDAHVSEFVIDVALACPGGAGARGR